MRLLKRQPSTHPRKKHEPDLTSGCQSHSRVEHLEVPRRTFIEQPMIKEAHGLGCGQGAAVVGGQRQDCPAVILPCPLCLESHQAHESLIVHSSAELLLGIAESLKILGGEIDAVASSIFAHIAQNVSELECHS